MTNSNWKSSVLLSKIRGQIEEVTNPPNQIGPNPEKQCSRLNLFRNHTNFNPFRLVVPSSRLEIRDFLLLGIKVEQQLIAARDE